MRGVIKVVMPEEFILWKAKMTPAYVQAYPPAEPAKVATDTTAAKTVVDTAAAKKQVAMRR
jgi:hypothetical protein